METTKYKVEVHTWYRESTKEWIGEITYKCDSTSGGAQFTEKTEKDARNTAFMNIPEVVKEMAKYQDKEDEEDANALRDSEGNKITMKGERWNPWGTVND